MEIKSYWFITVFDKIEPSDVFYVDFGDSRCWGFYSNRDSALKTLHNNSTDLFEGCYHFAVLEEYYEGISNENMAGRQFFEYDKDKHLYYRYQYGDVMTDAMNGQKIGVTNVVLKLCHGEERMPDDARYDFLAFGIHGTGKAYVFTNGKMIEGTWEKSSDPSADYLYDEEGNEIILNQGKTWVCCVWKEYSQYVTFE